MNDTQTTYTATYHNNFPTCNGRQVFDTDKGTKLTLQIYSTDGGETFTLDCE